MRNVIGRKFIGLLATVCATLAILMTAMPSTAQQQGSDGASGEAEQVILKIKSDLGVVKISAYAAMIFAAVGGLLVFVYRRKRLTTYSKTAGAIVTVVLSLGLFSLFSFVLSSPEANTCVSAVLEIGNAAKDYDDVCRAERESAANAFGGASAYRSMFVSAGQGFIVPIGVTVLKFISHLSVLIASLLAFFILRPICEKSFAVI